MNLVIFSPVSLRSAIGRMAALVAHALVARGCVVTIVRTEARHLLSTDMHEFGAPVLAWNDDAAVVAAIRGADACVYQIGNSFEFHEGAIHWLAAYPGLICLHDFFLAHLFHGWAQQNRSSADAVLQHWYGSVAAARFFRFLDNHSFIEGTRDVSPMTEWICAQATGVITHSAWGCDRVLDSFSGPVRVVPLAYNNSAEVTDTDIRIRSGDAKLELLTIGHINANKRVESVIEAIGRSPLLSQKVNYRLVGVIDDNMAQSLTALASSFNVNLVISGELDKGGLEAAILGSDIISCLRWPILEAASASAIEACLYGKAVIVTDIGFYAEIPDRCAIKINHRNEIPELQAALISLIEDESLRVRLGSAAQAWASTTFTASNYAEQIIGTTEDSFQAMPALKAIDYFCQTLRHWSFSNSTSVTAELTRKLDVFDRIGER